ncbi:phage tail protein [Spartinivicinus poritis]|uniref:Tail fiber protein n=1 Tax=Spartinivicinus poritis TaxID=2994640 RepID=A0ABT5U798_9GAMM|nr:tail fiber protein [Spartinivicinus sp. A2-2]MDE1462243.1 tail fiber protein [Spartinivicinus sp. A2-2]
MAEPYIGEIRIFAGNFAPVHWAFCDNNLIPVTENGALFSLLGNRYGGDGRSTFALPDMRGRLPVNQGTGPGLTPRSMGERMGVEEVTLTIPQMPSHTHQLQASNNPADSIEPQSRVLANGQPIYSSSNANLVAMSPSQVGKTGGDQPHNNVMPFLCVNFIIALQGIYPQRN